MLKQLLYFICLVFCSQFAAAQIIDGSFETDLPSAWQTDGRPPEILQVFTTTGRNPIVTIHAYDGDSFVLLKTGGGTSETNHGQLSQLVTLDTGDTITGAYFFSTDDYVPFNDTAIIGLTVPDDNFPYRLRFDTILATTDVADVNSYGAMGTWATFSHVVTAAEAGPHLLILRVVDSTDYVLSSYLAVDALNITKAPPPQCLYSLAGDFNNDCVVDSNDLTLLAGQWLNTCDGNDVNSPWCKRTDLNKSASVDFVDFAIFANNWLIDCWMQPPDAACLPKR